MSLGQTPFAPHRQTKLMQRMSNPVSSSAVETEPTFPSLREARPSLFSSCKHSSFSKLAFLNLLLFFSHAVIGGVVASYDITFPVTVFQTRLTSELIQNFTCIYDYGSDPSGKRWCETESAVPTRDFADYGTCDATMRWYNSSSRILPATEDGGPLLDAYELTRMGDNKSGASATRWILFSISAVTSAFHLLYAFYFVKMAYRPSLLDFFLRAGGVPARWYEYAVTASLMSFFIANLANVFEFYALLASALGTFALMYFGIFIESELYAGRACTSLKVLYVPSMALFVLTWLPNVRQIWLDILRISCADVDADVLGCKTKTCFGEENPIAVYVLVLMALFVVFPLISIEKVYSVGGFQRWMTDVPMSTIRACMCVDTFPIMRVAYLPIAAAGYTLSFLLFATLVGPFLALGRIVSDVVYPLCSISFFLEKASPPSHEEKRRGFLKGELLFLLASATSKLFLSIYFLAAFARRRW